MHLITCFTTVLMLMCSGKLFAQDTTTYCQEGAILYSDCYIFIKQQKADKNGTFIHQILTDDFGEKYVHGSFHESTSFIKLYFSGSPNCKTHKAFKRNKSGLVPTDKRGPTFKLRDW